MNRIIDVTCAIIVKDDKVLVTQRSENMKLPLKWEFPGGKVELNETPEESLLREIKEELNIEIKISNRLESQIHHYESFSIRLIPFISKYFEGEIVLAEHKAYGWYASHELHTLDWAEADLPVLNEFLKVEE